MASNLLRSLARRICWICKIQDVSMYQEWHYWVSPAWRMQVIEETCEDVTSWYSSDETLEISPVRRTVWESTDFCQLFSSSIKSNNGRIVWKEEGLTRPCSLHTASRVLKNAEESSAKIFLFKDSWKSGSIGSNFWNNCVFCTRQEIQKPRTTEIYTIRLQKKILQDFAHDNHYFTITFYLPAFL